MGEEEERKIVEDADGEVFYEVHCRGPDKCGSFVSSEKITQCPKCGSDKILLREVKKKVEPPK